MAAIFKRDTELNDLGFSFVTEREVLPVPRAYDSDGPPPVFRVVLRFGKKEIVCHGLEEVAQAIVALSFPMLAFAEKFPHQIASAIAKLALLSRPIQDSLLFKGVDSEYGVVMSDVLPQVVDHDLRWFELPNGGSRVLRERRLSLDSFQFQKSSDFVERSEAAAPLRS